MLADWLGATCPTEALRGWLDAGDHAPFEERCAGDGWFGVGPAADLGGQGGGLVELALAAEELGRRAAPASVGLGAMLALPAVEVAPAAAKEMLADDVAAVLATPAASVPGPLSGVTGGSGISGTIASVLAASRAKRLVLPVGGPNPALRLVDVDQPGVQIRPRALTDRSRCVADVVLDGARGTPLPGDPVEALEAAALRAAVLIAADALGGVAHMVDLTVEYALTRKQFGVPIGSLQAVKHAAADMLVKVESSRSIVYLAAASVEAGHADAPLHAAAARAQVCSAAAAAADTALPCTPRSATPGSTSCRSSTSGRSSTPSCSARPPRGTSGSRRSFPWCPPTARVLD